MKIPSVLRAPHSALRWLPDMDLNHDKQIQSLLCYRYTIGQSGASKVELGQRESRRRTRTAPCAIGNLLSRRVGLCGPRVIPPSHEHVDPCRLPIGDTADCQSALRASGAPEFGLPASAAEKIRAVL